MRVLLLIAILFQSFCFSQQPNKFFDFSMGYRMPTTKPVIINSGHGLYVEAGIDPLWFVSKKIHISIFGGYALRDNLWSTSFNDNFAADYTNSIVHEKKFSSLDSAIIAASTALFAVKRGRSTAGCQSNSFHNYSLYYGVSIKLPMQTEVFVKLYTGSTRTQYRGSTEITALGNNNLQLRRKMYGGELMLRDPVSLIFKSKHYHSSLANFGVGIYCEFNDMYTASLFFSDGMQHSSVSLNSFTHPAFLSKYKREQLFGFKLSYSVL